MAKPHFITVDFLRTIAKQELALLKQVDVQAEDVVPMVQYLYTEFFIEIEEDLEFSMFDMKHYNDLRDGETINKEISRLMKQNKQIHADLTKRFHLEDKFNNSIHHQCIRIVRIIIKKLNGW